MFRGSPDCELAPSRCVIYWVGSELLSPYLHQIASPDVFLGRNPPPLPMPPSYCPPTSLCPDGNDFFFVRLSNPFLSWAIFHRIVIGNLRRAEEKKKNIGLRPSLVNGKQSLPLVVK